MKRVRFSLARGAMCLIGTVILLLPANLQASVTFFFSTGNPDGKIATASRPGPDTGPNQETESADDFILAGPTQLNGGTFTGLLPLGFSLSNVSQVTVEIYRVFPKDSDAARTPNVPTRVNSPSDVQLTDRDSASGNLTFTPAIINPSFTALNSVDLGIHPSPGQHTGGDGPVTGEEVQFNFLFSKPLDLPADHYFFVPQVLLSNPNDHFLWLSAPKPILPPGTPFTPDLQSWIRNDQLALDWLRIGTDITGAGPFNATFSLSGVAIPEPASLVIWGVMAAVFIGIRCRRHLKL